MSILPLRLGLLEHTMPTSRPNTMIVALFTDVGSRQSEPRHGPERPTHLEYNPVNSL